MVAIETRFIAASNFKPTRIVAESGNGQRLVMTVSKAENMAQEAGMKSSINADGAQLIVAQALADKMKWHGKLVGGGTKRGMCFVFVDESERPLRDALKRAVPWLGKLIADGAHMNSVAPQDAVGALDQAERALISWHTVKSVNN